MGNDVEFNPAKSWESRDLEMIFVWTLCITHMHGLAVYVKEGPLEKSTKSYCFCLALLHSVSYFFFLSQSSSFGF